MVKRRLLGANMNKNIQFSNDSGYTLVELLISITLAGVLIAAVLQFYVNQNEAFIMQEMVADMQTNIKTAFTEVSQVIRMAGSGFPEFTVPIIVSGNNLSGGPDTITIRYVNLFCTVQRANCPSYPADFLTFDNPECLDQFIGRRLFIAVPPPHLDYPAGELVKLTANSSPATCRFEDGSELGGNIIHLSGEFDPNYYTHGSNLYVYMENIYFIDKTTDPDHPDLIRIVNDTIPLILAEDIEDMQFQYITASGQADTINANESGRVKGVQLTITGRTRVKQRIAKTNTLSDGYRRLTLSSEVNIRRRF
jgi:prepilin-type N-terminal cleavage/methylation domain-containing protein